MSGIEKQLLRVAGDRNPGGKAQNPVGKFQHVDLAVANAGNVNRVAARDGDSIGELSARNACLCGIDDAGAKIVLLENRSMYKVNGGHGIGFVVGYEERIAVGGDAEHRSRRAGLSLF